MTSEQLLYAMDDIPDDMIFDAVYAPVRKRRGGLRRMVTVALAAALVLAMSLTAAAYVGAGDWFKWYFDRHHDLTHNQQQYIDDRSVGIGQSVTKNGYTITLDSVIMDGQQIYVRLLVFAPEGISLKTSHCLFTSQLYMEIDGAEYDFTGAGETSHMFTDRIGELNEVTMVINRAVELPEEWKLSEEGEITIGLRLTDLRFSSIVEDEDWTVDGQWDFQFALNSVTEPVELLTEPVTVTMGDTECPWNVKASAAMYGKTWEVTLHSIRMTPLGMTVHCQILDEEWMGAWYGEYARFTMKDGSTVLALMSGADLGGWYSQTGDWADWRAQTDGTAVCTYYFPVPVDPAEADYLEFEDGTKIHIN